MKAIIPAAGVGTRFLWWTRDINAGKAMSETANAFEAA